MFSLVNLAFLADFVYSTMPAETAAKLLM